MSNRRDLTSKLLRVSPTAFVIPGNTRMNITIETTDVPKVESIMDGCELLSSKGQGDRTTLVYNY